MQNSSLLHHQECEHLIGKHSIAGIQDKHNFFYTAEMERFMRLHTEQLDSILDAAEREGRYLDALSAIDASLQSGSRRPNEVYYEKAMFQLAARLPTKSLDTVREQQSFVASQDIRITVSPLL